MNCEIKYNGIGIRDEGTRNTHVGIQCIIESNGVRIRLGSENSHYYCNRICNNTSYGVYYTGITNCLMPDTYWCTPDSASTGTVIYDGYDNINYGLVIFMPINTQCYFTAVIGIPVHGNNTFSFNLSPNPTTNELRVQSGKLKVERIEMYNVVGERCLTLNPSPKGEGLRVDVSSLREGIYFVRIKDNKGNTATRKFVKM